jgi:hypothetical protein
MLEALCDPALYFKRHRFLRSTIRTKHGASELSPLRRTRHCFNYRGLQKCADGGIARSRIKRSFGFYAHVFEQISGGLPVLSGIFPQQLFVPGQRTIRFAQSR